MRVGTGGLTVTCLDFLAVESFAGAWADAADLAVRVFPGPAKAAPVARESMEATTLLRVSGQPALREVHGIPAAAAPGGRAHVKVTIDRLVVAALDRRAVESWARCWADALTLAEGVWGVTRSERRSRSVRPTRSVRV